jgi:hypothetical protein
MGFIAEILSLVKGSQFGAAVSNKATIAHLRAEREATLAVLEAVSSRRRTLLLSDAPDEQISALEKIIDGHHRALERLELREDALSTKLHCARTAM